MLLAKARSMSFYLGNATSPIVCVVDNEELLDTLSRRTHKQTLTPTSSLNSILLQLVRSKIVSGRTFRYLDCSRRTDLKECKMSRSTSSSVIKLVISQCKFVVVVLVTSCECSDEPASSNMYLFPGFNG